MMKRTGIRSIALTLTTLFCLFFFSAVAMATPQFSAADVAKPVLANYDDINSFDCVTVLHAYHNDAVLRYVPACSHPSGIHQMDGRGSGDVYVDGELVISEGYANQCVNCYEVIISEYNPRYWYTTYLGWYGMWNPGYEVPAGIVRMYTDAIYYNDDIGDQDFRAFEWI